MRDTTLLEVMAEVGETTRRLDGCNDSTEARVVTLDCFVSEARSLRGDKRRNALRLAAAMAVLALHAHDAEAAKAGT